ncbi:MAG: hypothetical protein IV106_25955 [Pseudomonas umsongensis]|nr:hypothetical protein [Pseudomonas umsongensis]
MNFQINRWFGWVGEPDTLEEMRASAFLREATVHHGQVGNYGLALRTIVNWLDAMLTEKARPLNLGQGVCE